MPSTLLQCFETEHPQYPPTEKINNAKAKAFSSGTLLQDPPKVLVRRDYTYYMQIADRFLQSSATRSDKTLSTMVIADADLVPGPLALEMDVVQASAKYLIHPIVNTLNCKYPAAAISAKTEEKVDKFRYDLSFKAGPSKLTIGIIEFKRIGYIKYDEFKVASCTESDAQNKLNELQRTRQRTVLDPNQDAFILIKQATAYALAWRCRYVALCDYETLVLLRYDPNFDLSFADVTTVPRAQIRKTLLGFFIDACDYAKLI